MLLLLRPLDETHIKTHSYFKIEEKYFNNQCFSIKTRMLNFKKTNGFRPIPRFEGIHLNTSIKLVFVQIKLKGSRFLTAHIIFCRVVKCCVLKYFVYQRFVSDLKIDDLAIMTTTRPLRDF